MARRIPYQRFIIIENTFDALLTFYQTLSEEESRAVRENLDDETLVLFDLLKKPALKKKELEKIKRVVVELLQTLKTERLNVSHWREKERARDGVRQGIYDYLYDDKTGLPESYEIEEIETLTAELFNHVYRVYPTLPSPVYG